MKYLNLSYDYAAAFFLLMLLIWYITEKKVPLKSYRYFACVLVNAFLATILEIITFLMVRHTDIIPYEQIYLIMSLQMLCIHSFITCLAFCLLSMAHIQVKKNAKLKWLFLIAWTLDAVICLLNPILHWAAVLKNGVYSAVGVGYILYVIDAVMAFLMAGILIQKRFEFKFLKKSLVIFLFVCGVIAGVVQILNFAPMLNLAITVFCLVMYLFQQSPDAVTDEVTEQFSRRFFGEYLKDKFIEDRPFSVIVVDMDDFKFINQNYGVGIGDALLRQVGKYLEDIEISNVVFHFDADRFCVVVDRNKISPDDVANGIRARFTYPWDQNNLEIMMSVTACIIDCPEEAGGVESLIEVIDYAMEIAKSLNKGSIVRASEMDLAKIQMSKNVEKAVKDALNKGTILIYYQPIFSAEKQCYSSAEALVRLHDEKLGWIPPDIFVPIAEKSGFIIELGELILHKVCRFIEQSKLSETTIEYIDINVSPLQLMQKGFADKMLDVIKQYDVSTSQINVEITETAMMTSFSVVNENLSKLISNHIAISLDDYGTGYANINYINQMPFRFIKIDKDIIQASFKEGKASITLEYTIGMLNALNLSIVAEGVETEVMKDELIKIGCHYLQGWYYSKAVPEAEFLKLI